MGLNFKNIQSGGIYIDFVFFFLSKKYKVVEYILISSNKKVTVIKSVEERVLLAFLNDKHACRLWTSFINLLQEVVKKDAWSSKHAHQNAN